MSKTFNELPVASALVGTEILPINQVGTTCQATVNQVLAVLPQQLQVKASSGRAGTYTHSGGSAIFAVISSNLLTANTHIYAAITGGAFAPIIMIKNNYIANNFTVYLGNFITNGTTINWFLLEVI